MATTGDDDPQKTLDELKKLLQNQQALADAQKALAESQTQAAIARLIGDVKAGPYSGSVDMKPGAGTEEALLLGARAVKEAAERVAGAVGVTAPM